MNLETLDLRRRRLIVFAATVALLLGVLGAYLTVTKQSHRAARGPDATGRSHSVERDRPAQVAVHELQPIRKSSDPAVFATAVADALFAWDTTSTVPQAGYVDRLIAVADPTGEESPGLSSDVSLYLPTPSAWADLRPYETRQWLEVRSSEVPKLWPQALAEAGGGLLPGTMAYTIHGVRHRDAVWEGSPVASEHDVAFTVFIVCAPSYPTCHLLRLSKLDDPLG